MRSSRHARTLAPLTLAGLLSIPLALAACDRATPPADGATPSAATAAGADASPASVGTPPTPREHEGEAPADACPSTVPGTSVRATDVDGGAALEVTTSGDVASVRTRTRAFAEHRGMAGMQGHGMRGPGPGGGPGGPMAHAGAGRMMDLQARVEDIEGGARIVLTPREGGGADLPHVRAHARHLAERMTAGGCPPMLMM